MSTTEYLAEVAAMAAKATPGPWTAQPSETLCASGITAKDGTLLMIGASHPDDAAIISFIAAARSDVPKLLKIIAHQAKMLDVLAKMHLAKSFNPHAFLADQRTQLDAIANEP